MARTAQDQYLKEEVLGADPLKLVWLLYRGAVDAVGEARRYLAQGAIRERTKQINKAWQILQELSVSLDHDKGGDLSRRLEGLYAYMQTRLLEANSRQSDEPLREVEGLLADLCEAWQSAAKSHEETMALAAV